ncbi:MAG: anhydro-N-acetylmuramic acid kinase [Candidatus Acidiferrales bacterium]|jgi:anhydro-N-acetylmuramic acid kinase
MNRGRAKSQSQYVLGLMSGTSADGIDIALARISGAPPNLSARLAGFYAVPYPRAVREEILRIANIEAASSAEISRLNFALGELFARAALAACREFRIAPRKIALIGSHGQTIYHQGRASKFPGVGGVASTMQIGEAAVIAARTGITAIADFRPADMAVGGQGAPLVPFVDYALFRDAKLGRVALNIGGIANVTVIPAAAKSSDCFAFDTGPGNMVIDALVRHFTRGRETFDRDARRALAGKSVPRLLDKLLSDRYFQIKPPKSAGREQFGEVFAERVIRLGKAHRATPDDLVRTATLLGPLSIADAFHRFIFPRARFHELIVSGGGTQNPLIMAQLAASLPGVAVRTSDEFGVPSAAKEAFAFAILAYEAFHGRTNNLPSATGARRPAILGKVSYAPPR